ncbi:MAG TPA: formate dehydrogenase accessory sulfurtransferase FdhD [Dongiaceae bacterium]|jgi:formate dehydrogenase accessory protein FdhD|nr:formate dehydrogenase accessory sulfurtransferase FdhD [Dongiaceae bacterium]
MQPNKASTLADAGAAPVAAPLERVAARRLLASGEVATIESVAAEVPVALVYNGTSHVVMMATPQDLADFALGFSLSEGILRRPSEMSELEIVELASGIEVRMTIDRRRAAVFDIRRRNLAGRTGCGICGVDSLEAALRQLPQLSPSTAPSSEAIRRALAALPPAQRINSETHSVHAAAWADMQGEIKMLREDVGRHNALDKLIGAMAEASIDPAGGFAVITSRCSMEMVQKSVTIGIPTLVAISAPTTLAIKLAQDSGLRMIALARADSLTVYAEGRAEGGQ